MGAIRVRRNVLRVRRLDSIDRADDRPADQADKISRQQADDEQGHQPADDSDEGDFNPKADGGGDPEGFVGVFKNADQHHGNDPCEAILEVYGGLQFAAFRRRITVLHPRAERREKHGGGERQQREDR